MGELAHRNPRHFGHGIHRTPRDLSLLVGNPRVVAELRDDPQGERAGIVMLLGLPDGRELPVNYLREGNQVFAGADGRWWRPLRDGNAPVRLLIRGETFDGQGPGRA